MTDSTNRALLVIVSPHGQLGNRLIHFAHHIGCALGNGVELIHCGFGEYSEVFRGTAGDLFCHFPKDSDFFERELPATFVTYFRNIMAEVASKAGLSAGIPIEEMRSMTPSAINSHATPEMKDLLTRFAFNFPILLESGRLRAENVQIIRGDDIPGEDVLASTGFKKLLERNQILLLDGWSFRDTENVPTYMNEIREYFRPIPSIERAVETFFSGLQAESKIVVGIHARLGDYREFEGGRYFFQPSLYADFIRTTSAILGNDVRFVLCSDEIRDLSLFSGLPVRLGPGSQLEDMYTLAKCAFVAGPPSTFTGWSAFYGGIPKNELLSSEDFSDSAKLVQFLDAHGLNR